MSLPQPVPAERVPAAGRAAAARPVDADAYRAAMGRFASGVTVVTTRLDGIDHAMTANALTSVSLDPLLLLVCVEREARFHDAVIEAGTWGVSILADDDRAVSQWLASRGRPLHGQLDRVAHHPGPITGAALFDGALATLECRTRDVHDGGDHSIVVGGVIGVSAPPENRPALVWYRGRYRSLA